MEWAALNTNYRSCSPADKDELGEVGMDDFSALNLWFRPLNWLCFSYPGEGHCQAECPRVELSVLGGPC